MPDEIPANDDTNAEDTEGQGLAESLYDEPKDSASEGEEESKQTNESEVADDKKTVDENAQEGEAGGDDDEESFIGKKVEGDEDLDEESKDGGKKPDDAKAPEKIELSLSDGSLLEEGKLEEVSKFAEKNKLSQAEAEDLLGLTEKAVSDYQDKLDAEKPERDKKFVENESNKWLEESLKHPDTGGDKFKPLVTHANRYLNAEFSKEFIALAKATGIGNHWIFIRDFGRNGQKHYADDTFNPGGDRPDQKEMSFAESLYGEND